jgi:hypothetical protein
MPSTYTLNNGIELIATGEQSGTWGDTTNVNLGLIDTALDGQVTITLPAAGSSGSPNALAISDGSASNGRNRLVVFDDGGDLGATAFVQLTPNDAEKIVYIRNNLSGGRAITLFQGTYNASNDYEVPAGTTAVVFFDGGGSGAVAANVFNNAYFDSLRLGGVSVTAILDEDNMASDSATALATQQSIKAYVDAQVGANNELSEVLANGNTSGGNDIQMTTTDEVQFRDTALTISSSVDGQLDIAADVELEIVAPTVDINASTAVTIDTTTMTMTGSVNVVGDLDVDNLNINGNAIISTNTDGNIALTPNGTGEVDISKVDIDGGTIDGTVIGGSTPAAISGTTITGTSFVTTGDMTFGDNDKAIFGAGSDLQIYHDGSNSFIDEVGTGRLYIRASDGIYMSTPSNALYLSTFDTGGLSLFHNGNAKLDTTATGIDVTGTAVTDGVTVAGNLSVDGGTIKLDGNYPVGTANVALGDAALDDGSLSGGYNTAIGRSSLTANTTGAENTGIGNQTLQANTSGSNNNALGTTSLYSNTTGSNNTAAGYQSLFSNTTADNNTAVGYQTLYSSTGDGYQTAAGAQALYSNTTGAFNNAFGRLALYSNTTGSSNSAFGQDALFNNTTASNNTAVGYQAGYSNVTGTRFTAIGYLAGNKSTTNYNTFVGSNSGENTTSGGWNSAVGDYSLQTNTTGTNNTAIGQAALYLNTTGGYNTALGSAALGSNTTASNNTAVGYQAGYSNTTGSAINAFGYQALDANTTGANNIAMGNSALGANTTGSFNTAMGDSALAANTTANDNVAVGQSALDANTTGASNVALGRDALGANTTASNNTAVGYKAGYSGTTASENVIIGTNAGYSLTTGVNNTFVGGANPAAAYGAGGAITTGSKNTIIGRYDGNQGGLDIRTASNNIVLSDGDGNPRLLIDSSGNVLVGKTVTTYNTAGISLYAGGAGQFTASSNRAMYLNRLSTDGDILQFDKDGTTVGSIGSTASTHLFVGSGDTGLLYQSTANAIEPWNPSDNNARDNAIDLGITTNRFKNLYLSGGVYLGGTTSANHLDDYEEGTWTPTVGGTSTYTVQAGSYTKIGRMVYLNFDMRIILLGTGSSQYISPASLPFAFASAGSARAAGSVNWFNALAISRDAFYLEIDSNGIYLGSNNGASNTINEGAAFGDGAGIMASLWYTTTA